MPLAPNEARALDESRQLPALMRLAGVRTQVKRDGDGWVSLTLRGTAEAIEHAKVQVERIVMPHDLCGELLPSSPPPVTGGACDRGDGGDGCSSTGEGPSLEAVGALSAKEWHLQIVRLAAAHSFPTLLFPDAYLPSGSVVATLPPPSSEGHRVCCACRNSPARSRWARSWGKEGASSPRYESGAAWASSSRRRTSRRASRRPPLSTADS